LNSARQLELFFSLLLELVFLVEITLQFSEGQSPSLCLGSNQHLEVALLIAFCLVFISDELSEV